MTAACALVLLSSLGQAPAPATTESTTRPAIEISPPITRSDDEIRRLRDRAKASTRPAGTQPADEPVDRPLPPPLPVAPPAPPLVVPTPTTQTTPPPRPITVPTQATRPATPAVPAVPPAAPSVPSATPTHTTQPTTTAPTTTAPTTAPAARKYSLNYFDTPWTDVLDDLSRIAGMTIIGDTKQVTGNLTFRSSRQFDFDGALEQINELLLARTSKMLLVQRGEYLEIGRLADLIRNIPPELMFSTVADFERARLRDHEMCLVVYSPPAGWPPIDIIDQLGSRVEDYYGRTVFGDKIILTGMARDHRRFFDVVNRFVSVNPTPPNSELPWKSVTLRNAKAGEVQQTLRNMYPPTPVAPRPGQDPDALRAKEINIVADVRNNTILIKASEQKTAEILRFVEDLDGATKAGETLIKVLVIEHGSPDEIANQLRTISQNERQKFMGGTADYVSTEEQEARKWDVFSLPNNPRLVVIGGVKGVARAEELAVQLDVAEPPARRERLALEHASVAEIVPSLTAMFQKPGKAPGVGLPVFTPDNAGNAVIVTGRGQQFDEAVAAVKLLDQPSPPTDREHIVKLERAQPTDIANALTQTVGQPQPGKPGRAPPRFIGNDAGGYLLVRCTDSDWPRFEKLIMELDGQVAESTPELRTFKLEKADALEVAAILTPMFGAPLRKGLQPPSVKITGDARDNTLRVWSTPDVIEKIAAMIPELDIASDSGRVQTIMLENADAAEVAASLTQVFGPGARPPTPGQPAATTPPVKITGESMTNSLLVVASKSDFDQIRELAMEMDRKAVDHRNMRVPVKVNHRTANEVADALKNLTVPTPGRPGQPAAAPLKIVPTADQVVLDGPKDLVIKALDLIQAIDVPGTDREVRLFAVSDPEEAEKALRTLMASGGGGPRPPGPPGTAPGPTLGETQIYADTYRKVLVVHAPPAQIPKIESLVKAIEQEVEPPPGETPGSTAGQWTMIKLKFREARDIIYDLEDIYTESGKKGGPEFRVGPDDRMLLVKSKPRLLPEIERMAEMFDVPSSDSAKSAGVLIKTPKEGLSAIAAARLIATQFQTETGRPVAVDTTLADRAFEVIDIHAEEPPRDAAKKPDASPCVLPGALRDMLASLALAQDEEPLATTKAAPEPPAKAPLQIVVTDDGKLVFKGDPGDLQLIETLLKDLEEQPATTQIKVFPIKYRDVTEVGQTLELIFNERAAAPVVQVPQQAMPQPGQSGQPGQPGQPGGGPRAEQGGGAAAAIGASRDQRRQARTAAAGGAQRIRVTADARTRQLFVRALAADFPLIVSVLRMLDVEINTTRDIKFFQLRNLDATTTARVLRETLGLEQRGATGGRRFQQQPGQQMTPEQMQQMQAMQQAGMQPPGMPGQQPGQPGASTGVLASPDTTTITAEEQTNSIIASGTPDTLKMIGNIIETLENQNNQLQPTLKRVELKFARAAEIANTVRDVAGRLSAGRQGRQGGGGGGGAAAASISINPDTRTNSVILAGAAKEVERVCEIIEDLDVDTGAKGQVEIFTLKGDANAMANALKEMYARGERGGASDISIAADATTSTLLVRAPDQVRKEIAAKIEEMEGRIRETATPRTIRLQLADVDSVAKKLAEIFSERGQRGGAKLKITPVSSAKSLVVQAPDDLFAEIEKAAKSMDVQSVDLDIRRFTLKHAKAVEAAEKIKELMTQIVQQMGRGQGSDINLGLFAFTPDALTNSLLVTGNPMTFAVTMKALESIDVEPSTMTRREVRSYVLNPNVNAAQVANNISQLFAGLATGKDGIPPPSVAAEPNSNIVLVTATEPQHKEIQEKIIKPILDTVAQEAKQHRVALKNAKADEVANTLRTFFDQWRSGRGNKPQDQITIVPDANANVLLVTCTDAVLALFNEQLAALDVAPAERVTRTFTIKYAAPWTLADIINQQFQQRSRNPNDQVVARFEDGTSSIVVLASERNMEVIEKMIADVDVPGATSRDTRFIKLEKARADDVSNVLNQAWQARTKPDRTTGRYPVTVTPDLVSNSLLVTSSELDYEETVKMVRSLDVEPPDANLRETHTYQLRFGDPWSVVNAINNAFQPPPGRSPSARDVVRAAADPPTGNVIISATRERHAEIAKLIAELDRETEGSRSSRILNVSNSDPRDVAQALTTIYAQKQRTRTGVPPVTISALQGSTKLVVNCNEAEFGEIKELVRQIDEGGDKYGGRSVHTVTLPEQVKAKSVAESITRLFAGQGFAGQAVKAEANDATNTVLVFATPQEFEKIDSEVIQKLSEVPTIGTLNIYRVKLKYAVASEVARTLQDFFRSKQGLAQQGGFFFGGQSGERAMEDRVTVSAEPSSNMLIIACTEATKRVIDEIIAEIDSDVTSAASNVVEMFYLKYMNAADMLGILEEYLKVAKRTDTEDPQAGLPWWARGPLDKKEEKTVLVGDTRLKALEAQNALIVVSKSESIQRVRDMINRLDVPTESPANAPKLIALKNAKASQVAPMLSKAFSDPARGQGKAGYRAPVILPETSTNSLLVTASVADVALIERTITELDRQITDGGPTDVRVVPLPAGLDVVGLARSVSKALNDAEKARQQQTSDYKPDLVTIEADLRTNSLIVAASKSKFDEVNRLVEQLVALKPGGGVGVSFIKLNNVRPEDAKRLLEEMQKSRGGPRSDVKWKREFGPDPRPGANGAHPRLAALSAALVCAALAQAAPPDRPVVSTIRRAATTQHAQVTEPAAPRPVTPAPPATPRFEPRPELVAALPSTQPGAGIISAQLSGAPITIQAGPGGIVVIGSDEDRKVVESLLTLLDQEVPQARIEYVELKNAQAVQIAKQLQDVYQKIEQGRPQGSQPRPEDKVAFIADARTNGLYIAAVDSKMAEVIELVRKSDLQPAIPQSGVRTFVLKHRRVRDVEPVLKQTIQMLLKTKGVTDTGTIGVEKDEPSNTLFVTGGERDLEEVAKIVDQIDRPPPKSDDDAEVINFGTSDVMIVPLRVASSEKLAPSLQKLIQDASTGQTPTKDFIRRLRVLDDEGRPIAEMNIDVPTFIVGDPESNSLVAASSRKNLLVLREVIRRFDVEPLREAEAISVRSLQFADATEVAENLKKLLDESKKLTARATKTEPQLGVPDGPAGPLVHQAVVTPDPRTNTLILAGRPEALKLLGEIVDKLDVQGVGLMPFGIIKLQYASASQLEQVIDELMKKREEALPKGSSPNAGKSEKVIIKGDPRAETLIVAARADRMAEVRELVQKLDIPATALVENIRTIQLKNGNAADLAKKVDDLWTKRAEQKQTGQIKLEKPAIVADERSNSLVVASSKGDFEAIEALVTKLESLPFGPIADIRIVPLQYNSAKELAPILKNVFSERAKQREGVDGKIRPSDQVALEADPILNALLVACSRENFELLTNMLKELDVERGLAGVAEMFMLQNVEAARVKKTLEDIFKDGLYKPGGGVADSSSAKARDKVTVAVEDRSNTIIVSASPENMSVVRSIVKRMDDVLSPWNLTNTRLFQIENADAVKLAAQLADYFKKLDESAQVVTKEKTEVPITVIADERTNRLLVGGTRDGIARAEKLIVQLDVVSAPSSTIEVYRLQDGAATKIGPTIEQIFKERNTPRAGGSGGTAVQSVPVTVKIDETSNALVISASREDQALIKAVIALLDHPSNILEQVKLFALRKARADSIKKILEELYKSGASGGTGGSGAGGPMPVAVTTDARTNSIVVAAPPGEMENIAKLVDRLDSATPIDEAQIGIFPLENADAKPTAELLKEIMTGTLRAGGTSGGSSGGTDAQREIGSMLISFIKTDPQGREQFYKSIRENVQVSYDERTNAVIVVAPPPSVALIKNLVRTLDSYRKREVFVRVFPLRNADAAKTVELLEKVFAQDERSSSQSDFQQGREIVVDGGATSAGLSGAGGAGKGTFGKPRTTFTADVRTNSVVVAGWPEDIGVAADIVDQLDAQDVRDRVNLVYALQNAEADTVVTALDSYFQKQAAILDKQGEGLSPARKAEQEVSAVGHKESNQVILSFSPRYQSQVLDIVRQLDTPPPQVMIQVLLAEVTLDNRFELGMEYALQQLRFSETAVAGPNGTLSSNSFDIVGGTDLGAAASSGGLGGFAFTITGEDFNFLLRALQSDSKLEVLQRPMIMCQDNQEASINVGQSVPFLRGTQVTDNGQVNSQIEYQDIGVKLNVEPHINPDGFVYMKVKPEISQITPSTINVGNGIIAPIFSKRDAETSVVVKDGETVVIGGLITTSDQETENKVPVLGDLPVAGVLFRTTNRQKTKTELLIVLTPRVIRTIEDGRRLAIEARDVTSVLTPEMKQSPLMAGLQVKPETFSEVPEPPLAPGEPMLRPGGDQAMPGAPAVTPSATDKPVYGPFAPEYGPIDLRKPGEKPIARAAGAAAPSGPRETLMLVPEHASPR